ncbi:MAG: biopolymer transporter ExbD [Pseudomonadota bacterium]|nr:biopolymer transporter ExbD [Pseudomonadota bacterium]
MKLQPRQGEEPELNLTPLIDVVFLLLIFFMVTTSFIRDAELRIELPKASLEPQVTRADGLAVVIDQDGRFFINEQEVVNARPETLRQAMTKVAGDNRGLLRVRADARASHQAVVTVLDVAGQLGFSDIVIETANLSADGS